MLVSELRWDGLLETIVSDRGLPLVCISVALIRPSGVTNASFAHSLSLFGARGPGGGLAQRDDGAATATATATAVSYA